MVSAIKFLQQGEGKKAQKNDLVSVHYKGQLADGTVFDSSYKRNDPIEFTLGVGQVIAGWDEGIALLHVGEKLGLLFQVRWPMEAKVLVV